MVTISLSERQKSWLILTLLWLVLLLLAAMRPLAVPDEGRYGEISRWMLQSTDWLTPRLNGIPFFHKPPLLHWLQAISLATFGVNEVALRLVPALHGALMLVALYLAARSIGGEQTGRRAAFMLGSSLGFLIGGQYVNHDMLVATWIGVAIWCFAFAFMAGEKPAANLARLGFVACALGMLSKGLIGIALPGMVMLIWLIWTRQLKKIIHLPWFSGLALFAVIALPWFAMAWREYPQVLDYMFVNQQFTRYTASTYNNPQPWWFYLASLLLLLFPWVFFVFGPGRQQGGASSAEAPPPARQWLALCWIWVVSIVVFFSIPHSKLIGYVLPVIPGLALLAALGWQRSMAQRPVAGKLFVGLCLLNAGIALAIVTQVAAVTRSGRAQDLAEVLACALKPSETVYVTGAYPYDLPFYAQLRKPMVVLDNWPLLRREAGDGWQRELFEGADFDPQAAALLQSIEVLPAAGLTPGHWLVLRIGDEQVLEKTGWKLYYEGAGWRLYRSEGPSTAEGPKPAQQVSLPGCKNQRHE